MLLSYNNVWNPPKGRTRRPNGLDFQPAAELGLWETEIMSNSSLKLQFVFWLFDWEPEGGLVLMGWSHALWWAPVWWLARGLEMNPWRRKVSAPRWRQTVGGKEIKHKADSALFTLTVCGLHPCRGVCAPLMSLQCSTGMLKPPTQRTRWNNTAFV